MKYVPKSMIIATALVGLAGCAIDPITDRTAGAADGAPPFADQMLPPENAKMIVRVANTTVQRGDNQTAVALYRRALSIDSENFEAAAGLAQALSSLGVHEEAADAWRVALKLNPNDTEALRGLGNTLVAMGLPAEGVAHYERALSIKPEPRLYSSIGVAHDMLGDYNAAQAYYRVGLQSDPKNLSLQNNLGLSLLLSGKTEKAVAELKRAVSNPKAGMKHRMNLALALVQAGDSDSALSIARMDFGPGEANRKIAYFETIRALGDSSSARQAIQAHIFGSLDQKRRSNIVRPVAGMVEAR